jgi:hypothetical protein
MLGGSTCGEVIGRLCALGSRMLNKLSTVNGTRDANRRRWVAIGGNS